MTEFEANPAAIEAVFDAKEVTMSHLLQLSEDTTERFSVRGQIKQVILQ